MKLLYTQRIIVGLFLFSLMSCTKNSNQSVFLENHFNRIITCDTIFSPDISTGYLTTELYEIADSKIQHIDGIAYTKYSLSIDPNRKTDLIRIDGNKIFLLSRNAPSQSRFNKEQILFDFDAEEGDSWNLGYAGIFSGFKLTVDSTVHKDDDIKLHITTSSIFDISDITAIDSFVISKKEGLKSITAINPSGLKVNCDCSQ